MPTFNSNHVTEFQILSFLPGTKPHRRSFPAGSALRAGLQVIASQPQSFRVHWMRKDEDPLTIVIISQWTERVNDDVARGYIPALSPYLRELPAMSFHVDIPFNHLLLHWRKSFHMFYFPLEKCTDAFIAEVEMVFHRFDPKNVDVIGGHGSPEKIGSTSNWVKEVAKFRERDTRAYLLTVMWLNEESEREFKRKDEGWKRMIAGVRGLGLVGEEEWHGSGKQVRLPGEDGRVKYEFSESESESEGGDGDKAV